ncbi:hypothetical protein BP5796_12830 [Coleophoma crateriformis]|uniref:Uncharacterized protein n=1 Tax=Coleophoma crateriformis TaxID=565419 RepID=A0A3D8Q6U2_9HELO|nr:hypothetical protein BP5796_12830 [Coleophoma crateriformis]
MRLLVLSGTLFACGTLASVLPVKDVATRAEEPCARVSALVAPMLAANPNDLAFKKKPPADYEYPPVDLVDAVTKIVNNLTNKAYSNEYAWQMDVFKTFMSARDGHFRFAGDLISRPIRFSRNVSVVSVSMDGVAIPKLYVLDDVQRMQSNPSFQPSAISKINNQDAVTYIQNEADRGFQQDKDAAYNTVMYNPALDFVPGFNVRGFFAGDGRYGFFYPGAETTLNFANGSTAVYQTKARVLGNFTGVVDGESAWQKFCTNPKTTPSGATAPAPTFRPGDPLNSKAIPKGFPKPQVISSDLTAAGYYLQSTTNKDVGVLSFNSFEPNTPAEFQAVVQTMLAEMKRDGKTKLIVDLQGNGGGVILNGYDTFRQLFPKVQEVVYARQRVQTGFTALAQQTSDKARNFNPATSDIDTLGLAEDHFNYRFDLNQDRQRFTSFEDKFGPVSVNGDMFTHLQQWNWSDPLITINQTTGAGMDITGYGSRQNFTQPFLASNIVMLYDGICASTCTLFSEMMRNQGNVKSIALGGRPTSKQIQAIGGVKGAQSLGFDFLRSFADFFLQTEASNNKTTALAALTDLPQKRSLDNGINFSDQILVADVKTGIPAQFVREIADCRLFYTPKMMSNITEMWEAAANVAWRGKSCVAGGISEGIVSAREVPLPKQDIVQLNQEAADARSYLEDVRTRAATSTVQRMPMWDSLHGKEIPNMYV